MSDTMTLSLKPSPPSAEQAKVRPSRPKFLQVDLLKFLQLELHMSKPGVLKLLKRLQSQGSIYIDHSKSRETMIAINLEKLVSDEAAREDGDGNLVWPLHIGGEYEEDMRARMKTAGIIAGPADEDDWFTEDFLGKYREAKKKYGNHLDALVEALTLTMGTLNLREIAAGLMVAQLTGPFTLIDDVKSPHGLLLGQTREDHQKNILELFEAVGEPVPAMLRDYAKIRQELDDVEERNRKWFSQHGASNP